MKNKVGYAVHITCGRYLAMPQTDLSLQEIYNLLDCESIETVSFKFPIPGVIMLVDESGKLNEKRFNPIASILYAAPYDYIGGDALLVKLNADRTDFEPFTEEEACQVVGTVRMMVHRYADEDINLAATSSNNKGGH